MTTEEQQHNPTNSFQAAIEAIEGLTAIYKIKFTMIRTPGKIAVRSWSVLYEKIKHNPIYTSKDKEQ